MKFPHVSLVAVFYAPTPSSRRRVGRLALKERRILFEYDAEFVDSKLEISPIRLPLARGVIEGPSALDGLPGVFDDSLPDGWGRLLVDRHAAQLGLAAAAVTPLDRLSLVGARSMGALVYEPEVALDAPAKLRLDEIQKEVQVVLREARGADLEKLIAIGGSPKGARPKVLVHMAPDGTLHHGARTAPRGHTSWLVKFPAETDDPHVASLEHAYFLMAGDAGLEVPRTQLLAKTKRHPGYFAIARFDRRGATRVHMHTAGGLLHVPLRYAALDYLDLLKLTRAMTRDEKAVREMFRRACFNVLAHNRDDHSRNFAFLMSEDGEWHLSPAYDLTYSHGPGGEHTTLVAGEGKAPGVEHLKTLAKALDLKGAARVIDGVRAAVGRFRKHADEAGVPAKLRDDVARSLAR